LGGDGDIYSFQKNMLHGLEDCSVAYKIPFHRRTLSCLRTGRLHSAEFNIGWFGNRFVLLQWLWNSISCPTWGALSDGRCLRTKFGPNSEEVTGKSCPTIRHGGAWGRGGLAPTHSRLRHWMGWRPGRTLPPGKRRPVPIGQEAVWAPEPVWTQRLEEKSFRLCRGSVVQSVSRHYTVWGTPAAGSNRMLEKITRWVTS
jgi:hypothetical protein